MNNVKFCCVCICAVVVIIAFLVFCFKYWQAGCCTSFRSARSRLGRIEEHLMFLSKHEKDTSFAVTGLVGRVNNLSGDVYACKCMLDEISQYYSRLTKEDVERITNGTA